MSNSMAGNHSEKDSGSVIIFNTLSGMRLILIKKENTWSITHVNGHKTNIIKIRFVWIDVIIQDLSQPEHTRVRIVYTLSALHASNDRYSCRVGAAPYGRPPTG